MCYGIYVMVYIILCYGIYIWYEYSTIFSKLFSRFMYIFNFYLSIYGAGVGQR